MDLICHFSLTFIVFFSFSFLPFFAVRKKIFIIRESQRHNEINDRMDSAWRYIPIGRQLGECLGWHLQQSILAGDVAEQWLRHTAPHVSSKLPITFIHISHSNCSQWHEWETKMSFREKLCPHFHVEQNRTQAHLAIRHYFYIRTLLLRIYERSAICGKGFLCSLSPVAKRTHSWRRNLIISNGCAKHQLMGPCAPSELDIARNFCNFADQLNSASKLHKNKSLARDIPMSLALAPQFTSITSIESFQWIESESNRKQGKSSERKIFTENIQWKCGRRIRAQYARIRCVCVPRCVRVHSFRAQPNYVLPFYHIMIAHDVHFLAIGDENEIAKRQKYLCRRNGKKGLQRSHSVCVPPAQHTLRLIQFIFIFPSFSSTPCPASIKCVCTAFTKLHILPTNEPCARRDGLGLWRDRAAKSVIIDGIAKIQ